MKSLYVGMVSGVDDEEGVITQVIKVTGSGACGCPSWFRLRVVRLENEPVVLVSWTKDDDSYASTPTEQRNLLGVNDPEVVVTIHFYGYHYHLKTFASRAEAEKWNGIRAKGLLPETKELS
jgi:hypothetical protein